MGLVGAIVGTLGTAFLAGRAQQQQYEAAAAQARTNAQLQAQEAEVAQQNALKANKQAEETARVNAQNVEDERRRKLLYVNKQIANIGKSGLTNTGSASALVEQSRDEIDYETEMNHYNGRNEADKWFGVGTDYANQSNKHKWNESMLYKNARDYEAAGNRAFWSNMLGGVFSLAGNLYSSKSSAVQTANSQTYQGSLYSGSPSSIGAHILSNNSNTPYYGSWAKR